MFPRLLYNRKNETRRVENAEEEAALGEDWQRKRFPVEVPADDNSIEDRVKHLEKAMRLLSESLFDRVLKIEASIAELAAKKK